jgi:hypothetical protein
VFLLERGAALSDGTTAPHRRAVYAVVPDGAAQLDRAGWLLFDALSYWLTN